ncbi:hypothetical protein ACJIZ3_006009 [Penstemon smallii]|uniref:C2 domain-containing protein n=1 Tax=Penstemon smallii TaxID=265156 RepID=A0ABD3S6J4_9LAMI
MDPSIPTPTASSAVTSTSVSSQAPPSTTSTQILEISLISAQDLSPISKSMRTYAVTWINPTRKLSTRIDQQSHRNPMWNEKFAFRVDNELLMSEDTTLTVEIYTTSWFRDVVVGIVRVLVSDLIAPSARVASHNLKNTRFVALQVRRPSGSPQGILNMGVALLDKTMRSMPLHDGGNFPDAIEKKVNSNEDDQEANNKIQLWRSLSTGSEINNEDFPQKPGLVHNGSMVNGSIVNGSELCSDIGPSASIVAADIAKKMQPPPLVLAKDPSKSNQKKMYINAQAEETGSSILEELTIEEAKAKGYRITSTRDRRRKKLSKNGAKNDNFDDQSELSNSSRHSRRNSDGGLFSCFGNAYGIEFTIVCGASNNESNGKLNSDNSRRKIKSSKAYSA